MSYTMSFRGELLYASVQEAREAMDKVGRLLEADESPSTRYLPDSPDLFLDQQANRLTVDLEVTGPDHLWFALMSLAELLVMRAEAGRLRSNHDLFDHPTVVLDARFLDKPDDAAPA